MCFAVLAVGFVKSFAKLTALIEGEGRAERETANRQAERLQRVASSGAYRLPISRFSKDLGFVREDRSERGGEVFCGVLPCFEGYSGQTAAKSPAPSKYRILWLCLFRAWVGPSAVRLCCRSTSFRTAPPPLSRAYSARSLRSHASPQPPQALPREIQSVKRAVIFPKNFAKNLEKMTALSRFFSN